MKNGGVAGLLNNLIIEMAWTEEEAAEGLDSALDMEVVGDGEKYWADKGKEEGKGTLLALLDLEFLTQDADPSRTTLVDACNSFNELSRLAMLWTVRHLWPAGARFAFICCRHWAQLLLLQMGEPPVTILIRKGLTQGDPLSVVLYRITLVPLQRS